MKHLNLKTINYITTFIIVCIIVVIILIITRNKYSVPIKYFIPGDLENIGCLAVYIDDPEDTNDYSFDNGATWQKNKYGAVYGHTTILVRNKDKKIIYKKKFDEGGFTQDAPIIKINYDQNINNKSDSELLKGVSASLNGRNLTSNIKTNILEEKGNELLVSYLVNSDINRCYLIRKVTVNNNGNTSPSITSNNIVAADKWVWPTNSSYRISSHYGWRGKKFHSGVDITGLKRGSPIYAARAGVVTAISSNSSSGYYVTIKHDNGYYTRYAHMQNTNKNDKLGKISSANKYVFVGLRVKAKDIIGEIGSSGNSTGLHLHFEIWDGKPYVSKSYNPLKFYKK